jgi:hypothetical protein
MAKRTPVRIPDPVKNQVSMFENESDRAAAVLAGAYLEEILDRLLRSCLITDEHIERLFSNASQKVHLLFAMGVIEEQDREELLIIQKVRNFFAHHVLDANDFDHPTVAALIDHLAGSMGGSAPSFAGEARRDFFLFAVMWFGKVMAGRTLRDRSDDRKRAEAQARHRAVNAHRSVMRIVEGL